MIRHSHASFWRNIALGVLLASTITLLACGTSRYAGQHYACWDHAGWNHAGWRYGPASDVASAAASLESAVNALNGAGN